MISRGLPGFRDFPPEDFALRAHIFRVWREVAGRYGFEEYDGPPLEPLELYTAKSGDEIVGQLYNFVDKGDRQVALRPEMTPTLARMVGARANGMKKPIRWFSIPQLFRYERQQRGRLREHFQLNCDLIGEAGPLADAEIIALSIDMMRGFGLGPQDVRVRVSDRRLMTELLVEFTFKPEQVPAVFHALDRMEKDREGRWAHDPRVVEPDSHWANPELIDFKVEPAEAFVSRSRTARPDSSRSGRNGPPRMDRCRPRRSSAASPITPAPSSNSSTPSAPSVRSAVAGATTHCSIRSAAQTCLRLASAWATWCSVSC